MGLLLAESVLYRHPVALDLALRRAHSVETLTRGLQQESPRLILYLEFPHQGAPPAASLSAEVPGRVRFPQRVSPVSQNSHSPKRSSALYTPDFPTRLGVILAVISPLP
jgi:hypothetical protein